MTYKEKKQLLESYISTKNRIVGLQNELLQWRTIGTNITQKITPVIVSTNENSSKVERCAIKCAEIEQIILEDMAQAEYERKRIEDILNGIKDSRRKDLMTMRYINNLSVRKIAILYDADENSIYKQIRRTITSLDI